MIRSHLSSLAAGAVFAVSPLAGAGLAQAAHQRASRARIVDCTGHQVVAPRSYVLACGDGNTALVRLHWTHWGGRRATATGTEELNLCVPDCADGRLARFPVRVIAERLRGGRYRELVVRAGARRPRGVRRVERWYPIRPGQ